MVSNKVSITLVLFFCINLISTNIYANTLGGWSMSNPVAQGASVLYNGAKNVIINGANVAKTSTALITPTATGVAKVLAKGVAGVALSVAVEQLLGAVDWVLDPANNQIKYKLPSDPTGAYLYNKPSSGIGGPFIYTVAQAQTMVCQTVNSIVHPSYTLTNCSITGVNTSNPAKVFFYFTYDQINSNGTTEKRKSSDYESYGRQVAETPQEEEKTIPLPTVAQQVISNAQSGDAAAQVATTAAAADIVKDAESDNVKARPIVNQLEANSKTETDADANTATGSQTQNPTKPEVTNIKLEFPKFCGWAPIVCEAAQVAIAFPRLVTGWWETANEKAESWATSISQAWTSTKEWVKEEPSKDDQVQIQEKQPEKKSVDLNFGSACPAPVVLIDSTFYDQPFKIEYSFNDFCSILSDFVRPVLIAMAAFIAALILGGVKTNE